MQKQNDRKERLPFAADAAEGCLCASARGSNTPPPPLLATCAEGLGEAVCARPSRRVAQAAAVGLALTAGVASAKWNDVDISRAPLVQVRRETVAGKAASLLPPGKTWKLVWHDEFDGAAIDRTKWMCRESFWGSDFPAFAHGFEGVEMTGETVRLHLLRKGDDFCSPHLQTGSLTYDIPKDTKGFWPFGAYRQPLFMHRYGYYEIRCRLPKYPGWHAAFWLQAPGVCWSRRRTPGACRSDSATGRRGCRRARRRSVSIPTPPQTRFRLSRAPASCRRATSGWRAAIAWRTAFSPLTGTPRWRRRTSPSAAPMAPRAVG